MPTFSKLISTLTPLPWFPVLTRIFPPCESLGLSITSELSAPSHVLTEVFTCPASGRAPPALPYPCKLFYFPPSHSWLPEIMLFIYLHTCFTVFPYTARKTLWGQGFNLVIQLGHRGQAVNACWIKARCPCHWKFVCLASLDRLWVWEPHPCTEHRLCWAQNQGLYTHMCIFLIFTGTAWGRNMSHISQVRKLRPKGKAARSSSARIWSRIHWLCLCILRVNNPVRTTKPIFSPESSSLWKIPK